MQEIEHIDKKWMRKALQLAENGKGYVSPNPLVGCIILDEKGEEIGAGFHKEFGGPHAEVNAVSKVKDKSKLKGATVYVTLEPCAHTGKTPPCADMLAS
jgi:diaminohydroxyphosphoribosylaminopyrimidine deaminase/5-amino-6-(5-phosphoribosylamino)uracil reductase